MTLVWKRLVRRRGVDVREQALAALQAERTQKAAAEHAGQLAHTTAVEARQADVLAMAEKTMLVTWFPGAVWEVYAVDRSWGSYFGPHGIIGVVCTGRPGGTDPMYAGTPCFGIAPPDPVSPIMTHRRHPSLYFVTEQHGDGYSHWSGPEVTSLARLGLAIEATDAYRRGKLIQAATEACRCLRTTDPCAAGLRCGHASEHCARLRAVKRARCEMDVAQAMREWQLSRTATILPTELGS